MSSSLEERVSRILWEEWDPIGVNQFEVGRDEYDCYVPGICELLRTGTDALKLATRLQQLATVSMGMDNSTEHKARHARTAKLLLHEVSPQHRHRRNE